MSRKREPIKIPPRRFTYRDVTTTQKSIHKENIFHHHLWADIRKRLGVKVKDFPNHKIQNVAKKIATAVADWVIDNPEGFRMPYDMGYLAVSKYVMIPFREDRFEIINKVENLSPESISERFREIVLKKYKKPLDEAQAQIYIRNGKVITIPMWYNHRNCSIRKAPVFKWTRSNYINLKLRKQDKTKYHYYNFSDFYDYRIKVMDKFKI